MANTQIIVAKEGWIFIGDARREGDFVVLERAHNVRRWGTTKGLGELVSGPTENTVLDACGVVRIHAYNVMHDIAVAAKAWKAPLGEASKAVPRDPENIELVICERRWVYVGRVMRDGDYLAIREAMNLRGWTSAGIWGLRDGRKTNVTLDEYGFVRVGVLGVVASIDCDPKASALLPARLAKRGAP
jgi:hypothetical protein